MIQKKRESYGHLLQISSEDIEEEYRIASYVIQRELKGQKIKVIEEWERKKSDSFRGKKMFGGR